MTKSAKAIKKPAVRVDVDARVLSAFRRRAKRLGMTAAARARMLILGDLRMGVEEGAAADEGTKGRNDETAAAVVATETERETERS